MAQPIFPGDGTPNSSSGASTTPTHLLLYIVSGLLIVALAGFQPRLSIALVSLLIVGVLVENGSSYAELITALAG